MICGFCNREHIEVPYLIAGPKGSNICSECARTVAAEMIKVGETLSQTVACSFCGIADAFPHGIGSGGKVTICLHCAVTALKSFESKTNQSLIKGLELKICSQAEGVDDFNFH
jgi:hypothetical protein